MDTVPAPGSAAAATVFHADEEDVPLGWECACPALQIDAWGTDEAGTAARLVIES